MSRPPWFYGPFQPERQTQFFSAVRTGSLPDRRAGHATSVDGLHRQPRAGPAAARRRATPRRAVPTGSPTPSRTRFATILATVRDALGGRGSDRHGRPPLAAGVRRSGRRRTARPRAASARAGTCRRCTSSASSRTRSPATSAGRARISATNRPSRLSTGMRASIRWCLDQGLVAVVAGGRRSYHRAAAATSAPCSPRRHSRRAIRFASSTSTRRPTSRTRRVRRRRRARPRRRSRGRVDGIDVVLHNVAQVPLAKGPRRCSVR